MSHYIEVRTLKNYHTSGRRRHSTFAKITAFMHAVSIILLLLHFYWHHHSFFMIRRWTLEIVNTILLALSCLDTKGVKLT